MSARPAASESRTPAPERPAAERVVEAVYGSWPATRWFLRHMREVAPTASVKPARLQVCELPLELRDLDEEKVWDGDGGRHPLSAMLAATHTDAVVVLHRGAVVYERYFDGMQPESVHMYQSVSKSVGACLAARLIGQGLLSGDGLVTDHVPELLGTGYDGATVRHLLDMQVGVRFSEEYEDDDAEIARLDRLYGFRARRRDDEPGSSYKQATETVREGEHGRVFHYVSLDLQVLAWVMERATGRWLPDLLRDELWTRLGGEHDAYIALDAAGNAQLEGGFCSSVRDLARFGLLLCRDGMVGDERVLPEWFVTDCELNADPEAYRRAQIEEKQYVPEPAYRNNFWTSAFDGRHVFMGLGIFGQFLYVDRSADFVLAKFSTWPSFTDDGLHGRHFWMARSLAEVLA